MNGFVLQLALEHVGISVAAITGVLALRLAGIRWRISLPIFEPK